MSITLASNGKTLVVDESLLVGDKTKATYLGEVYNVLKQNDIDGYIESSTFPEDTFWSKTVLLSS